MAEARGTDIFLHFPFFQGQNTSPSKFLGREFALVDEVGFILGGAINRKYPLRQFDGQVIANCVLTIS